MKFKKSSVSRNYIICFLFCTLNLFSIVSCSNKVLIPEDDFIQILTDIYLSKAYFSSEGIYQANWQDSIPYNKHVVQRYGYQWEQFDSTVSWYCSKPRQYQEVYEEVMARLNQMDQTISLELELPSELWAGRKEYYLPIDGKRDSVPISILLKGNGYYQVKAKIRVYPEDTSWDPHAVLYLWRSDTTALGICDTIYRMPLRKDGLMIEYSHMFIQKSGNEFTHIKGNWIQSLRNDMDSTWSHRAEVKDISVYYTPHRFD